MHDRANSSPHPLLASRWSPTAFDVSYEVPSADVELLLEAVRWAPSAGNSQPWAFIVGRRGDGTHQRLVQHLAGSSARWAPAASLLVANVSHRYVEDTDWEYSEFAVPAHREVTTMSAVGRLPPDRRRRDLDDMRWPIG